jgi:hypothetical protein
MHAPLTRRPSVRPLPVHGRSAPPSVHRAPPRRRVAAANDGGVAAAADPPIPSISTPADAAAAVDALLSLIADTDRGSAAPPATAARADALIDGLAAFGAAQTPRPLENNPALFGNFDVAYVGTRGTRQAGQPAGGRWRSGLGRALFATTAVGQGVYPGGDDASPPLVTNLVAFRAFGCLPGHIGLRGVASPVSDPSTAARSAHPASRGGDTVRVAFDPPELVLGHPAHPASIALKIGPPSAVQLSTTFLDARVRLGRGSFGSRFVFTRDGVAAGAGLADVGTHATGPAGWAVLGGVVGCCAAVVAVIATRTPAWPVAARFAAAALPAVIGAALTAAVVKDRLVARGRLGREAGNEGSRREVTVAPTAAVRGG